MRAYDQIGGIQQGIIRLGRLIAEHVGACTGNGSCTKRLTERLLVYDPAAAAVDDQRRLFHRRQLSCADHIAGLVGQGHMYGHDVGILDQFFVICIVFSAQCFDLFLAHEGIIACDLHADALGRSLRSQANGTQTR